MPTPPTVDALEACLSEPTPRTIETLSQLEGDILVLGAGGKMGPSLARMARRAADEAGPKRRVIAVSRFGDSDVKAALEAEGVETIAGDLMDEAFVSSLPKCANVVYMVGLKFGTADDASRTWATYAYLSGLLARAFAGSRIVCFSTGNVYGLVPVAGSGSVETDAPNPSGEYAMSCLGRERVFEHFSRQFGTPMVLLRLNYATELRYGVLVDLARWVQAEAPISLAMGHFNVIWQADACNQALGSLAHASSPPLALNVTGPQKASTREVARRLGALMEKQVTFRDQEAETALLADASRACGLFGPPCMSLDEMLEWTAEWITRGGATWDKPTHFEVRDGKF